ncbi:hypothetical protein BD94_1833 [Elizabethkingia anophelis NUHP1]|uniref:Uncharacterized protein n=1 Tax=Elizabethkingia anophelis NUHP1 TaxID=1338011 RepID=A0A077EGD2_9FLAO|nr:hypothetical protein BD94_1833 [Elizabethkingia anophelis NUHP1]
MIMQIYEKYLKYSYVYWLKKLIEKIIANILSDNYKTKISLKSGQ